MISVDNLTKRYAAKTAINGLSFEVQKGEILGFLGPNGAGKTSTMRIITGYMPATGGTVKVDGFDVADQPLEVRRRIGYLPENPPLYPEMSVAGYLQYVAKLKGVSGAGLRDEVQRVMDRAREPKRLWIVNASDHRFSGNIKEFDARLRVDYDKYAALIKLTGATVE